MVRVLIEDNEVELLGDITVVVMRPTLGIRSIDDPYSVRAYTGVLKGVVR